MYGGQYNPTDAPERNGIFINVNTVESPRTRAGANGIVGIVGKADWGPDNEIIDITSSAQALDTYGNGPLFFAIDQALKGADLDDRSGAIIVRSYRITGASRAKAEVTLENTTPDPAFKVIALHNGVRGNSFTISTQVNTINASKRDLIVYENSVVREIFTYDGTGTGILASLADEINKRSKFIRAEVVIDDLPLVDAANSPLISGNSGDTLLTSDHASARAAYEGSANFTAFAIDDCANLIAGELIAYRDWTVRLGRDGKTFNLVVGGELGETPATALTRSVTMDTPDAGNFAGVGDVVVNITRDLEIGGVQYSSSQLAPRIAGVIVSADWRRSISGTPIIGATLINPPSSANTEALVRGNVVPFVNDGTLVRLDRGRTTYTSSVGATENKSQDFRSLLFVRKLWYTFTAFQELTSTQLIGQTIQNTPETVDAIVGMFADRLNRLEDEGVVISGATVELDESQDNSKETIHLLFKYAPAPGIEQVLAIVTVPV